MQAQEAEAAQHKQEDSYSQQQLADECYAQEGPTVQSEAEEQKGTSEPLSIDDFVPTFAAMSVRKLKEHLTQHGVSIVGVKSKKNLVAKAASAALMQAQEAEAAQHIQEDS